MFSANRIRSLLSMCQQRNVSCVCQGQNKSRQVAKSCSQSDGAKSAPSPQSSHADRPLHSLRLTWKLPEGICKWTKSSKQILGASMLVWGRVEAKSCPGCQCRSCPRSLGAQKRPGNRPAPGHGSILHLGVIPCVSTKSQKQNGCFSMYAWQNLEDTKKPNKWFLESLPPHKVKKRGQTFRQAPGPSQLAWK